MSTMEGGRRWKREVGSNREQAGACRMEAEALQ